MSHVTFDRLSHKVFDFQKFNLRTPNVSPALVVLIPVSTEPCKRSITKFSSRIGCRKFHEMINC